MLIPLLIAVVIAPTPVKTPFIVAKHAAAPIAAPIPQSVPAATCSAILQRANITGSVGNPDRLKFAANLGKLIGAGIQVHVFDADTVNADNLQRVSVERAVVDVIGRPPTKEIPGIIGCVGQYK